MENTSAGVISLKTVGHHLSIGTTFHPTHIQEKVSYILYLHNCAKFESNSTVYMKKSKISKQSAII